MHPNEQLITDFYSGFAKQNPAPMRAAYAPNAHFTDPAFGDLHGNDIGDMWAMLCEQARDFRLEFRDVKADETSGSVHWEAWYAFGRKRKVYNVIDTRFTFVAGRVTRQIDRFNFWNWSRQALGPPGLLLGWTPMLHASVIGRAKASLSAWQKRR